MASIKEVLSEDSDIQPMDSDDEDFGCLKKGKKTSLFTVYQTKVIGRSVPVLSVKVSEWFI